MGARDQQELPTDLPQVPEGWHYLCLREMVDPDRGISYGIVQPGQDTPTGVPVLRVNNLKNGRIDTADVMRVEPSVEADYARTRLRGSEVLLTLVGTLGQVATVTPEMRGWNVARAVGVVPVKDAFGPRWVALCLRSPLAQRFIRTWATTTVQATLNLGDVARLPIPVPPRPERDAIAHILGSLDDKIELNRRMNETLEALARAIFDDMFGSEAPDAVVGDLADIERDSVSPMDHEDEVFDHYSLPAFDEGRRPVRERGGNIKSNKFVVSAGAVLLSKLNPSIPRVWYPDVRQEPRSIASTEFQVMRPRATSSPEFLYCLLRSEPVRDHLVGLASGTSNSHQRVKPDDLLATPCQMPTWEGLDRFTRAVRPMLERANAGIDESATLAALRDALLPKLLSGELRIPDAEKMAEAPL